MAAYTPPPHLLTSQGTCDTTSVDKHPLVMVQMEGMVTDLTLAREKQGDFERWKTYNDKALAIDVSVTVLTTGFWPTYKVRVPKAHHSANARHCGTHTAERGLGWV